MYPTNIKIYFVHILHVWVCKGSKDQTNLN